MKLFQSVPCYFTSKIHLTYRSYFSQKKYIVIEQFISAIIVNFFGEKQGEHEKHLPVFSAMEGIIYAFDNDQI